MEYMDELEKKAKREEKLTQKVLAKIERFNLREEKKKLRKVRVEPDAIISLRKEAREKAIKEFRSIYIIYRSSVDNYFILDETQLLAEDTVCGRYNQIGRKIQ